MGSLFLILCIGLTDLTIWPSVQASPLSLTRTEADEWRFEFFAATGWVHRLEATHDLLESDWAILPSFSPQPGANTSIQHVVPLSTFPGATQKFFRVHRIADAEPQAPTLVLYTFTGSTVQPEENHPLTIASTFGISGGNVTHGSENSEEWIGSGVPVARGSQGWAAADPDSGKYFTFTLTASPGHFLMLDTLELLARATEAGPSAVTLLINDEPVQTESIAAATVNTWSTDVSTFQQLTQAVIRIVGWHDGSRTTTGGGRLEVDDVRVRGYIEEIPSDFVTEPTVASSSASARTESGGTLTGQVLASGGDTVTERGFFWSLDPDFTPPEQGYFLQEFGEFGTGEFSMTLDHLPGGVTVYYQAYAVNSAGISYSPITSFTTLAEHELVYYGFTGYSRQAEAVRTSILADSVQMSAGSATYGWVPSHQNEWMAMNAAEPYLQSSGGWTATTQAQAKRFEIDLTADNGWLLSVTGVTFLARTTSAGPSGVGVSVNGVPTHAQNMPANQVIEISAAVTNAFEQESIRIDLQGWLNGSRQSAGSGIFRIDDVRVSGYMMMVMTTDPPTVTSPTATGFNADQAILGGTVTADGGSAVLERGVAWSTNPDFTLPGGGFMLNASPAGLGTFDLPAYQLPPSTTIYYRAYARNAAGWGASELASFTTPDLDHGLLALYAFSGNKVVPHRRHPHVIASHVATSLGRPGVATQNPSAWTGSGVPYAQVSGGFNVATPAAGRYATFILEAQPGTTFTVTNIHFLARANTEGPAAVSVLIDDQVTHTDNLAAALTRSISVPVSHLSAAERRTFRIAGWNNGSRSTLGTGLMQFDDLRIEGVVHGEPTVTDTSGIAVRVASVNVRDGIAEPGDADHDALRAILIRMDADIVAFQELYSTEESTWHTLADDLGYPYWELAPNIGISPTQRVGIMSRFPLTAEPITLPDGANELARAILRSEVEVPDVSTPLVIWSAHKKAMNDPLSQFRRALETERVLQDIAAYASAQPTHTNWIVLGDLNADVFTQVQFDSFSESFYLSQQSALPQSFVLGSGIDWPLAYARYPDDRYAAAVQPLTRVPMTQPGGFGTYSFVSAQFISRLDYIYVSPSLATRNLQGEIYYAPMDGPHAGLPKAGSPLQGFKSLISSDHLPVFVDVYLDP